MRWPFSNASTPARHTSAHSSAADRIRWDGRNRHTPVIPGYGLGLCRCDHLFDQPSEAADVAGGVDGIAETDDHQTLRRQNDDALAEIAGCEKRVTRNPDPDPAFGMCVIAAIGPEAGAIVGAERGAG